MYYPLSKVNIVIFNLISTTFQTISQVCPMLTTEWLLAKLATAKYGWELAKFVGLGEMAMRPLLQRSGAVRGFKFRFFESRVSLVQTYPTLAGRLVEASRVDAMW